MITKITYYLTRVVSWVFSQLLKPTYYLTIAQPAVVQYNDDMVPENFGGQAIGIWVYIRTKYQNDRGLLVHELEHVRQFWFGVKNGYDHGLKYSNDPEYRLQCEVAAYKMQMFEYGNRDKADLFAGFIASKYYLSITKEEALKLLEG